MSISAQAHSGADRVQAELLVMTWAAGIQSRNAESVNAVLDEDFRYFGNNKDKYLDAVTNTIIDRVVTSYAMYTLDDRNILVSPIVVYENVHVRNPLALQLTIRERNGKWLIGSISGPVELPSALLPAYLPETRVLFDVNVSIRDGASLTPIAARVNVTGTDGEYWPPRGHMRNVATGWREELGGDVVVRDTPYAYVQPDFVVSVPAGSHTLRVARGFEYEPQTVLFEVSEADVPEIRVRLQRVSNIQAESWYSGDSHVHFMDPQSALLEARGEDLNVVNVLATKWGELITNVKQFSGAPSRYSMPETIVYVGEEARHDVIGHANLLNLKDLVFPLSWGAGGSGVPGGFDYPPMASLADRAHAQGGLVSWAHFPTPNGEVAIDIALGKIDAADIVTWGNPLDENRMLSPVPTWYRFLNCGFNLPAMAGTDKMWNTQVTGSVRTYVKVDGGFNYQAWIDGVKAGRTFVSTGPILRLSADGQAIGDTIKAASGENISVSADVVSVRPIERLEIIVNGQVVATKGGTNTRAGIDAEFQVEKSAWVAARAYSSEILPYQGGMAEAGIPVLAHTSPIYIDVDGLPRQSAEDAAYFIQWVDQAVDWARSVANFQNDAQRQEVIALYEQARRVYEAQLTPQL